ncbi:MAG: hypothetical protein GX957_15985 [Clostridiaceae bacterium]|nr:hypothetical protein [Clostridiaceae bacterium]
MDMRLNDEFRRRTNSSYDEAKYYLERFNGDLLEAIIAYERENVTYKKTTGYHTRRGGFVNGLIRLLQKLFDIKLIIIDKNGRTFDVPIILPLVLVPVWNILLVLAIIMWIIGFRFTFQDIPDPNINIESFVEKMKNRSNEW